MSNNVMKPCKVCRRSTMHLQTSTSHVLHLLLSIITAGIWLPIWFLIAQNNASQAQCTVCGSTKGIFGMTRKG